MQLLMGSATSTRALLLTFAIAIVVLIFGTSLLLYDLRQTDIQQAKYQLTGLSRILAEQTSKSLESISLVMRSAEERLSDPLGRRLDLDDNPVTFLLKARASGLPQLRSLFILDQRGNLANSSLADLSEPLSLADRSYYQHFLSNPKTEFYLSPPMRSRLDQEWSIFISTPLLDEAKKLRGILVASIRLDYFYALYRQIAPDLADDIELLNEQGQLIAGFPHSIDSAGSIVKELPLPAPSISGTPDTRRVIQVALNGVSGYVGQSRVKDYPLTINLFYSENRILAPWRKIATTVIVGVGFIVLLILLATLSLMSHIKQVDSMTRALRKQDERLQQLIHSVQDAIVTVDTALRIVMVNHAAKKMFGMPDSGKDGTELTSYLNEDSAKKLALWLHEGHEQPEQSQSNLEEIIALSPDGEKLVLEASYSSVRVQGQRYLTLVLRDISERQRAELALRESNRQLKELTGMLQQVREDERSRIAREMHDELGQLITGIRFELRWLESRLPAERNDLSTKLGSMVKQLDVTIASVRRITTELHPLILDDLGLTAAAGWLVDQFAQRTGIKTNLRLPETEPARGGALALALFRIMQESLTNIAKYAQATTVDICLQGTPNHWELTIKDNGIGFVTQVEKREGFGLIGMRERATLLGGSFAVDSAMGRGTQIDVILPAENAQRQG